MNYAQIARLPRKNHTKQLKAETPAEGETLQGLGGGDGEKIKKALIFAF